MRTGLIAALAASLAVACASSATKATNPNVTFDPSGTETGVITGTVNTSGDVLVAFSVTDEAFRFSIDGDVVKDVPVDPAANPIVYGEPADLLVAADPSASALVDTFPYAGNIGEAEVQLANTLASDAARNTMLSSLGLTLLPTPGGSSAWVLWTADCRAARSACMRACLRLRGPRAIAACEAACEIGYGACRLRCNRQRPMDAAPATRDGSVEPSP